MAVGWITPVDITPGVASSWEDVDVSGSVPAGASGVILHVVNAGGTNYSVGWRANASTDGRTNAVLDSTHLWVGIGVDGNRVLELYVGSTTDIVVWLVGYFTSADAVFFTNGVDKSLVSTGSWLDVDISGDTGGDTALGAVLEIVEPFNVKTYGVRRKGSTDDRVGVFSYHSAAVIGVDANEVFEGQVDNTFTDFYLVGYITADAVFITNATDLSLGSTGSWIDLAALPPGATGGLFDVYSTSQHTVYGLRENGTAENIVEKAENHQWGMVECGVLRLVEGYINATNLGFFLVGYTTGAVAGLVIPVAMRTYRNRRVA